MGNLEETDREAAAVAKDQLTRVTLADIHAAILNTIYVSGADIWALANDSNPPPTVEGLTICMMTLKNGFVIIGKSAPADPENYNAELGAKLAYEDALRQVWPLMGFALRNKLAGID